MSNDTEAQTLRGLFETATSQEHFDNVRDETKALLLKSFFGNVNVKKDLPKILERLKEPTLEFGNWVDTEKADHLYAAYLDVLHYGTPLTSAATQHGADIGDLTWLVGEAPIEAADKKTLPITPALRKLREPNYVRPKSEAPAQKPARKKKAAAKGK